MELPQLTRRLDAQVSIPVPHPVQASHYSFFKEGIRAVVNKGLEYLAFSRTAPQAALATEPDYQPEWSELGSDYWELTRRLSNAEKRELDRKLKQLSDVVLKTFIQLLFSGEWETLGLIEDYPYYALLAVRNHIIIGVQASTVFTYWAMQQYHSEEGPENSKITSYPLFINGEKNSVAWDYMSDTFGKYPITEDSLAEQIKDWPHSEQFIFVVDDVQPLLLDTVVAAKKTSLELYDFLTISQALNESPGINVFCRFERLTINADADNASDLFEIARMVPTTGLMQAFLDAKFRPNLIINPVLGHSTVEDIQENIEQGTCDVPFHFPGTTLPQKVDAIPAPWYDLTWYHFCRALIASQIPEAHQKRFVELSQVIRSYRQDILSARVFKVIDAVYNSCSFVFFRPASYLTKSLGLETFSVSLRNYEQLFQADTSAGIDTLAEYFLNMRHEVYQLKKRQSHTNSSNTKKFSEERLFWIAYAQAFTRYNTLLHKPRMSPFAYRGLCRHLASHLAHTLKAEDFISLRQEMDESNSRLLVSNWRTSWWFEKTNLAALSNELKPIEEKMSEEAKRMQEEMIKKGRPLTAVLLEENTRKKELSALPDFDAFGSTF